MGKFKRFTQHLFYIWIFFLSEKINKPNLNFQGEKNLNFVQVNVWLQMTTTTLRVSTRDSLLTLTQFSSGSQSHPSLPIILPGTIEQHTMCHPTKDRGCSGWFLGLCSTVWVHTSSAALILQQIKLNPKSWFPQACVCRGRHKVEDVRHFGCLCGTTVH